jgi:hypothetical protein
MASTSRLVGLPFTGAAAMARPHRLAPAASRDEEEPSSLATLPRV